ncbi:MAG: arginase family protein [Bryobacteraceae bacterium]
MRRPVTLIEVPYHAGLEGVGVGAGPRAILKAGADAVLAYRGMPAQVEHVRMRDMRSRGLDAIVDVNRLLRAAVRTAVEQESLPVVLAGNCAASIGVLAGLEPASTGIVWLDRHADFNTPETSPSGSVDGMALAVAAGHCHDDLRFRSGLENPVPEDRICLPFSWDLDPAERVRLEASAISNDYPLGTDATYVHLDVDVVGAEGENLERAFDILRVAMTELPAGALCVANYNPETDSDGRVLSGALRLLRAVAEA